MKILDLESNMDLNLFKSQSRRSKVSGTGEAEPALEDLLLDQLRRDSRVLIAKKLIELEDLLTDLFGQRFA